MNTHHQLKESRCPSCEEIIDMATCMTRDKKPAPGDITICLMCGHIMAFADDMGVRNLTDKEMVDIAGNPGILAIQRARAEVIAKRKS